jgi:ketosteroid isomerase-like protein
VTNAEVVQTFYDGAGAGDLDRALAVVAAECAWTEMAGFPYAGTYHGPDGVRDNVFANLAADWDGFRLELDAVHDAGDTVFGVGTYAGTCKATGKDMRARVVHVFQVRDGQIRSFEQFTDTRKVIEAMHP